MRCDVRRAVALAVLLAAGASGPARADQWPWHHTIPKETLALDYRTGDVMMAPPIPYGEYTKDYVGAVHGAAGMAAGLVHGLPGHLAGLCKKCGAKLCGLCGGLGHRGGRKCGSCGGDGCGHCGGLLGGHGLFGHGGDPCGGAGCGGGHGLGLLGHRRGAGAGHAGLGGLCGPGKPCASPQSSAPVANPQGTIPSGQAAACGLCKGLGHIGKDPCRGCGGKGLLGGLCGLCGGRGRLAGGDPCGGCGGLGHLLGGLKNLCKGCGGAGCNLCAGRGLFHGPPGLPLPGLGHGGVEYFVGPGGPVPITPGYVPYVVPTRSPRDYFAFPPFTDRAMP